MSGPPLLLAFRIEEVAVRTLPRIRLDADLAVSVLHGFMMLMMMRVVEIKLVGSKRDEDATDTKNRRLLPRLRSVS